MLSDLFLDFEDPTYIFNQGRCFQMNGRFKEAISRFREYLRTGGQDKAITEKHITECEDLVQVKPSPTASPEVKPVLPTRYQPPTIEGQQQPEFSVIQPLPTTSSRGSSLRMAGAVIAGLGVAGLALGIVLNLEANRQASSIEPPNHTFNRDTESTRTNYETSSWIGYGVGVIGLSTGAIFYFVGRRQDIAPRDVVLVPTLGPGLTGAGFRGAF